jgi:hypothetical protein
MANRRMTDGKRGRPPLTPGQVPAKVQVYVAPADYDRAVDQARKQGVSVSELLRAGLRRVLDDDD